MPLLTLARILFGLVSLVILASAAYLLWSWWDGAWIADPAGRLHLAREPWRLWTGLALLAWSFGGRWLVTPLIARDDGEPVRADATPGERFQSPTGSWIHVETEGPAGAPTIIMTHGWGFDSTVWRRLRDSLSDRFRLVSWDLPGLGRSQAAPDGVALERFALDLLAVLERQPGPAILVGHSIGGMTIQTLLRDHAEHVAGRVRGVVLMNTTYTNPLRTMILAPVASALRWPVLEPAMRLAIWLKPLVWLSVWQSYLSGSAHLANRIGFSGEVTRAQLEHVTRLTTRNSPSVQARGNLAMFRWTADGALPRAGAPVLVIAGGRDIVTKPEASDVLARAAGRARLEVVGEANHLGVLEQAPLYATLVRAFADEVADGAITLAR
ncbi:alpha/beta hydrolase [uncultured Caulobacter sp.]|uniref:alpha/beta fold hydrolase n=1 Tax=uncultured Caulobacter sp. TaxID=158749 RepID=UPI002638EB9C|nr:alpha/beta hydrolase [uncultured Caulobacter sp.]